MGFVSGYIRKEAEQMQSFQQILEEEISKLEPIDNRILETTKIYKTETLRLLINHKRKGNKCRNTR